MSTYDLTGQGNVLSLAISHRLTLEILQNKISSSHQVLTVNGVT